MPKGNKASFYKNPISSVVAQAGSKKKNKPSKSSKKTLLPNPNLPSGGGIRGRKGRDFTKAESKGAQTMSAPKATDTQVNKRMSQAIESARSEESLLDGKDRRRVERKARIQDRAETRTRRSELQDKYGKKLGRQVSRAENNPKVKERAAKKTRKSELKSTYGKGVGKAKFKAEYASDKQKRKAASKTARSKKMSEAKSAVKSAKASLKEARRR
tara:strand:+ start:316 stop:957 length:642 start_codon:yes stop_codon:yes gene_type:complete